MFLTPLATIKYSRRAVVGLVVLALLVISPAHAEKSSIACKLLQPGEIESALGGKAAPASPSLSNDGGMTMDVCVIEISRPGRDGPLSVTILVMTNLPMDAVELLHNRNRGTASETQWKVPGAQFEEKSVGNALCLRNGRPGVAAHSVCSIPRARGFVEVDVQAPSQQDMASIGAVSGLVQKAFSRW